MTGVFIILVVVALVTIFSVQNAAPVAISFLFWKFEASLAIVLFLSMLAGVIITTVIVFSGKVRTFVKGQDKQQDRTTRAD